MKISQGTTSHTRECVIVHGSAEKMGFPREDKTRQTKPQIFIFANLAFSENAHTKNLKILQACHLYVCVSVINAFVLAYEFPAHVAVPQIFHNLPFSLATAMHHKR